MHNEKRKKLPCDEGENHIRMNVPQKFLLSEKIMEICSSSPIVPQHIESERVKEHGYMGKE